MAQSLFIPTAGNTALLSTLRRACAVSKPVVAMASAPTVTIGTSATITAKLYGYNSTSLTFLSAYWYQDTSNVRAIPVVTDTLGTGTAFSALAATRSGRSGSIQFYFDGSAFELDTIHADLRFLVWNDVTGAWEIANTVATGDGSTRKYIKVDFTTRALRRIRVEVDYLCKFFNVRTAATDTVLPAPPKSGLKGIVIGDSYVEGAGATSRFDSCFQALGKRLGIEDWRCDGLGGTGIYINNGGSVAFKDRFTVDVVNQGPFDLVMIEGSGNDFAQTGANITSALGTMLDAARAAMPNALIVVTGSWTANGNDTTRLAVSTAIQAALATRPSVKYLDMNSWITGTGRVGATVGDGNADFYIETNSPFLHPSPAGHTYREAMLVAGMQSILNAA